jgi:ketosteroid isomerase-like protein
MSTTVSPKPSKPWVEFIAIRDSLLAMSGIGPDTAQNAETVRRFMESWTNQKLDGVLECAAEGIEFDWSRSRSPFRGIYKGHDGLIQFWADQQDAWSEFSVEIVEVVPCDLERLITVTAVRGRGRGSGITMDARGATLWRVRDGAIQSARLFQDKEEALEAAGPAEEQGARADS